MVCAAISAGAALSLRESRREALTDSVMAA
jgi:hypothetical protein